MQDTWTAISAAVNRAGTEPAAWAAVLDVDVDNEVCKWASDRGQVLSRTVRGVMLYGDALRVLARLEGVPEEEIEMVVASNPNPNPSPSPSPNLTLTLTLTLARSSRA